MVQKCTMKNVSFETYSEILTVKELCSLLKVGRNTAYDLIHSGAIRHIRIKNQIRIPKVYVIEYIQQAQKEDGL